MKTRQHVNMSDVIVKSRNSEVQELQSDIIDCVLHSVVTYTMTISKLDKNSFSVPDTGCCGHQPPALLCLIVTREIEGEVIFQFNTTQGGG